MRNIVDAASFDPVYDVVCDDVTIVVRWSSSHLESGVFQWIRNHARNVLFRY